MSISRSAAITQHAPLTPSLIERFHAVRAQSLALAAPLSAEDAQSQSMPFASPSKWHLAHTTWFFETFVLATGIPGYAWVDPQYQTLFNSYYNSVGPQHPRPQRGLLTRPTLDQVIEYRQRIDEKISNLADQTHIWGPLISVIELGIHHEQQHQELMLTDLKHLFSCNPVLPAYRQDLNLTNTPAHELGWIDYPGGLLTIGADAEDFCFDNETPRHKVHLRPFSLANRPVTNAEFISFIDDGGYKQATLWLSDGWDHVRQEAWEAPLYWQTVDGQWMNFTLAGLRPIDLNAPVCHISYFEADAYASWAGARLPLEAEWEIAANEIPLDGNFVYQDRLHPGGGLAAPIDDKQPSRMFGDVWEWTASAYGPYPGYRPAAGALGEYNGKFMCNQLVLRGGSCASPLEHLRASYRNFFQPELRWQFSGVRLARDV